jgi:hypothetical protein
MRGRSALWGSVAMALASVLSVGVAAAQPEEDENAEDIPGDEAPDEMDGAGESLEGDAEPDGEGEGEAEGAGDDVQDPNAGAPVNYDPKEDPNKGYWFMGLRFRNFIVPKFMINLFAEGGRTVNVFSAGPELSLRKAGFELDIAISTPWADYSMEPTLFKGHDDDDASWELVESDLKIFYLTLDLLKDIPLDQNGRFSLLLGGGVGFGGVFGELRRVQVFPDDPQNLQPEDPSQWNECSGPQAAPIEPVSGNPFCDDSNDHYAGYTEPSWANGGSKPFIFPYLALPHVAFRVKPIKQLQTRVDAGFSITGFFFGMAAGYALP